jgi:type IV pilus assembly protein PilP
MKRYAMLSAVLLALAGGLAGCGTEEPAKPAQPASGSAVAKQPSVKVPPPENPFDAAQVKGNPFVYQVEGRRDPFLPLLAFKGKASAGREFENPLEAYDLVQYQLKGVIIGFGEPKALILAPDGRSYILRKGLRIGKSSGVIREITRERIVVEERYPDVSGAMRTTVQEMLVPKREGV